MNKRVKFINDNRMILNCNNCVYADLSRYKKPCVDCCRPTNYFKSKSDGKQEMNCSNCRHKDKLYEVCQNCYKYEKWEAETKPTVERTCKTCKFSYQNNKGISKCPSIIDDTTEGCTAGRNFPMWEEMNKPKENKQSWLSIPYLWYIAGRRMKNGDKVVLRGDGATVWIYDPKADFLYKPIGIVDLPHETSVERGQTVRIIPMAYHDDPKVAPEGFSKAISDAICDSMVHGVGYMVMTDLEKEQIEGVKKMETLKIINERIENEKKKRETLCKEVFEGYEDKVLFRMKKIAYNHEEYYLNNEFVEYLKLNKKATKIAEKIHYDTKESRQTYYMKTGKSKYTQLNELPSKDWKTLKEILDKIIANKEVYKIYKAKVKLCNLTDCYKDKDKKKRTDVALKICESCGAEIPIEAKFCSECGTGMRNRVSRTIR